MSPSTTDDSAPRLRRSIGATSAVMITVGSVIGSGIFLKPLDISRALPNPLWIFCCWAALGLICLFGAFAYGELGTMFPGAGGQYTFLLRSWGRFPAFLYGWSLLLITNTGTLAALAVAFAKALSELTSFPDAFHIPLAVGMILLLAGINHFGVAWGALLQNLSTFAKLGALAIIVAAGFFLGSDPSTEPAAAVQTFESPSLVAGLVTACVAIFWAYEGWHQLPFSAEELKNPKRDLPRGLIIGVGILILTYMAVNAVYLHVVPQEEMRTLGEDIEVPKLSVTRIFGTGAGFWLTALVCLSVFGAGNPNLLSTPRAFYAMARDGMVFKTLTSIHSRYRTPTAAIWVQALWACVLVVVPAQIAHTSS